MSNVTMLTYAIALLPENADKIDQINRIILGDSYSAQAPVQKAKETVAKTDKPAKKAADKPAVKEETSGTTIEDLKSAAKKAKKDHGEDFVKSVIEDNGIKLAATLGRCMSAIPVEKYDDVIADWESGPVTPPASDDLDDDFDDDDLGDEEAVTAEAVKTALKAYSKEVGREEARKIMNDNGAPKLSDVDKCTDAQLAAMFKALV